MLNTVVVNKPASRSTTAGKVIVAHAVGLWASGMASTIGTTAGFSVAGGGLGLFLGGILSIPWMIALAILIWFYGGWIDRHPVLFAIVGPVVVCGSYALLAGAFLDAVAVSSVTSSIWYLLLTMWMRFRRAAQAKLDAA
jgi:hypothetical protein